MNVPLEIPPNDGRQLPDTRSLPLVIVFDSKSRPRRRSHLRLKKPKKTTSLPKFAFINVSYPGPTDEDSRRLVKTHVMQNVIQRAEKQESTNKPHTPCEVFIQENDKSKNAYGHKAPWPRVNSPQVALSNAIDFPVEMQPYMPSLLHNYAALMLPPGANQPDSAWLPLIMTDAALFHALLCTSALFLYGTADSGSIGSFIQRRHMLEAIRLINARLGGNEATSDATITTILFLAKAEHFQGNHQTWSVHMSGAKRIIELRGGVKMLSRLVQQKVYTTDSLPIEVR